ncbi:hypothetical protein BHM03_00024036 [Ensete ventricosum]|nr:hypothetical protein BHM03_00024036 [Ensete ventricosum]
MASCLVQNQDKTAKNPTIKEQSRLWLLSNHVLIPTFFTSIKPSLYPPLRHPKGSFLLPCVTGRKRAPAPLAVRRDREMGGEDGGEVEKKGRRKFAVLLCADDSEYVKQAYGGYFKVFVGLLGEEGEEWDVYQAAHGELPCMADVDGYDGFVITGSCNDAHGDDQWIKDLVSFLKALDAKKKKVLGVCFGHQVHCSSPRSSPPLSPPYSS